MAETGSADLLLDNWDGEAPLLRLIEDILVREIACRPATGGSR
jgi:hypothetical protein